MKKLLAKIIGAFVITTSLVIAGCSNAVSLIKTTPYKTGEPGDSVTWTWTAASAVKISATKGSNTLAGKVSSTTVNISASADWTGGNPTDYESSNYGGQQMGTSGTNMTAFSLTFGNPWGGAGTYSAYTKITSISLSGSCAKSNVYTVSATVDDTAATNTNSTTTLFAGTGKTPNTCIFAPASGHESGVIVFSVNQTSGSKAWYLTSVSITAEVPDDYVPPTTYNVSYNANGGSGSISDASSPYASGSTVTVKNSTGFTAPSGKEFSHWYTTSSGTGGTRYDPGDTFTISADTTLYAQWINIPNRTVTYHANNATSGSVPIDANEYSNGSSVTVLGNTGSLTKTGYIWSGWNTESDGTGISYSAGSTFTISANANLYARWIKDYSTDDYMIISGSYLGLTTTNNTAETTLTATDKMQYLIAPSSASNTAKATDNNANGSNVLDSSKTAIIIGKSGAYLYNKDALQKNIYKIEIFSNTNASTNVSVAVKFGTSICSSEYTDGAKLFSSANAIYTYTPAISNARYFRIQVTNAYNAQIQIKVYFVIPTTSVTVSPASVTLNPGDTQQLTTVTEPANPTDSLVYESDDEDVATVDEDGLITAVGAGTATITVTSGNFNDTCEVTVELPATPFITPSKESTSGYTGQNETINFLYGNLSDSVAVASDDPSVVTVSNLTTNGTSGSVVLNFAGAGSTTVKFKDGSSVTPLSSLTVTVTQTTVSLNKNSTSIYLGKSETLVATTNVGGVTWNSDSAKITVSNGVVTVAADAVINSTATITATSNVDGTVSATCVVTAIEDTRWNNGYTITKVADIDLPASGDTAEKYYVVAEITAITSDTYGNGNAIDEDGTQFAIYGMYNHDGSIRYDRMSSDIKPIVGDVVVLCGVFTKYNEGPEIKNARVVQRNGSSAFIPSSSKLNLKTDTTKSASTDAMTWEVANKFSMRVDKGESGTNANSYYPGVDNRTSTRFYSNHVVTLTPNPYINTTRIEFLATTDGYATAFANSSFTNASAAVSGTNSKLVIVTLTDNTKPFTVTIGATCGFDSVELFRNQNTAKAFGADTTTSSSLTYHYSKDGGEYTYSKVGIRFTGQIGKETWNMINDESTIVGYGIMYATAGYLNGDSIRDLYDLARSYESSVDDTFTAVAGKTYKMVKDTQIKSFFTAVPSEKAHPAEIEGNYVWNLFKNIDTSDPLTAEANLAAPYTAVAYIRTADDEIIFLNEITRSAADLALELYLADDSLDDTLEGSLSHLADMAI